MPEDTVVEMEANSPTLVDLALEGQEIQNENNDFKVELCSFSRSLLDDCCEICENKPASELSSRCCPSCSSCGQGCCGICPKVPCCPLPDRCNWPVVVLQPPLYPACCTGVCQTCAWRPC